jgi:hypothetical protein
MVITPDKVDAYLRAKGVAPRMSDSEWAYAIGLLAKCLKAGRAFQVKLLHQKEDSLRRFSCSFPDSIPIPYRFIDYICFAVGSSRAEVEITQALASAGVPFRVKQQKNGPEDGDVISVIYVGPDT